MHTKLPSVVVLMLLPQSRWQYCFQPISGPASHPSGHFLVRVIIPPTPHLLISSVSSGGAGRERTKWGREVHIIQASLMLPPFRKMRRPKTIFILPEGRLHTNSVGFIAPVREFFAPPDLHVGQEFTCVYYETSGTQNKLLRRVIFIPDFFVGCEQIVCGSVNRLS